MSYPAPARGAGAGRPPKPSTRHGNHQPSIDHPPAGARPEAAAPPGPNSSAEQNIDAMA